VLDLRDSSGQSSVELVALLPLIAALTVGCWQCVVLGQSWWLAGVAARAAARAQIIGTSPLQAARRALPRGARSRLHVAARSGGGLEVRLTVMAVVGGVKLGSATAQIGASER
jgi:uncharacterized membrane protein